MGKIVRYITEDGSAFILAADTTDIAARAEQIHHTSAVTPGLCAKPGGGAAAER